MLTFQFSKYLNLTYVIFTRFLQTKDLDSWFPFIPLLLLALLLNYDENTIISGLEKLREHHIFTEENTKDVKLEDPLCVNVAKSVNVSPETAFVQLVTSFSNASCCL